MVIFRGYVSHNQMVNDMNPVNPVSDYEVRSWCLNVFGEDLTALSFWVVQKAGFEATNMGQPTCFDHSGMSIQMLFPKDHREAHSIGWHMRSNSYPLVN